MLNGGRRGLSARDGIALATGAGLSLVLASVLLYGWPAGLHPDLRVPLVYTGDGLSFRWMVQRAAEGWIFENERAGFPFGSQIYDYPNSDGASFLILKALAAVSGDSIPATNLYIILSFPLNFVFSYLTLRRLGLVAVLAVSAAALYTFLPFPFMRLGHTHYLYYFTAPVFFYIGLNIHAGMAPFGTRTGPVAIILSIAAIAVLCSFGVYYALFGVIVVGVFAAAALARHRAATVFRSLGVFIAGVVLGLALNIGPTLLYQATHGTNGDAVERHAADAETLGFKLMQLVYPRPNHRVGALAEINRAYSATRPLINENITSALGIVGTVGLVLAFVFILARVAGAALDPRLAILSLVTLVLFLFGTVGGLGALFAELISSAIRSWNRISAFLAFGTIAITYLALHLSIARVRLPASRSRLAILVAIVLGAVGLLDQTTPACTACLQENAAADRISRAFVGEIERALPPGAAVYQIPFMPFPEVPPRHALAAYDHAIGFLDSAHLRWSYGCIKGRECAWFFAALDREPLATQLAVIRKLGFSGIYLDRRGYEDRGAAAIAELGTLLGTEPIERADGQVAFFPVDGAANPEDTPRDPRKIMKLAGYYAAKDGPRYRATREEGIDFRRSGWPTFVRSVSGIGDAEPWGRWSDASLSPTVRIRLEDPLPRAFSLVLDARVPAAGVGQDIAIRIGDFRGTVKLGETASKVVVPVHLTRDAARMIEIVAPPGGTPGDTGRFGIGLVTLQILPTTPAAAESE